MADKILQLLEKGKSKAARACPAVSKDFVGRRPLTKAVSQSLSWAKQKGTVRWGGGPTPPFFTSFYAHLKVLRANGDVKNSRRLNVTSVKIQSAGQI